VRTEHPHVGRLVPGEGAAGPAAREPDPADHLAEREHAVVAVELELGHRRGLRHRAVVGVVEQEHVSTPRAAAVVPDPPHQLRLVPLVDEHEVAAVERAVDVERREVVARRRELRVRRPVPAQGVVTRLRGEVAHAPRVRRLEDVHLVAAREELGRHAAQEMRVAMVPVGDDRVAEDHDPHVAASSCRARCAVSSR
jgi:hypothetical protein